jgi:hypothetical protein
MFALWAGGSVAVVFFGIINIVGCSRDIHPDDDFIDAMRLVYGIVSVVGGVISILFAIGTELNK